MSGVSGSAAFLECLNSAIMRTFVTDRFMAMNIDI
jgi:hypothetical protein